MGRPCKTEEEKRTTKREYMKKYNKERYISDESYKIMKQHKSRQYYRNKISNLNAI